MRTGPSRTGKVALAPSPTSARSGSQLKSGWMLWGAPTRCGAGVAKSTKFNQGEALEVTTKKNLATTTLFGLAVQMSAQEPKLGAEDGRLQFLQESAEAFASKSETGRPNGSGRAGSAGSAHCRCL